MNIILNKIGEIRLTPARFFGFWIALFAIVISLTSCSDDLDVQQSYPFTVEVMPYGDKITKGQTVELRFEIKPEGNYANTLYT
ncbi:TraQ conjugal transfer family protein, partial [uncultured Duncaniella sp.]